MNANKRKLAYTVTPLTTSGLVEGLGDWLVRHSDVGKEAWVLGYADDGVIWGRINTTGDLMLSGNAFGEVSPPLRVQTLQLARIFGAQAEVRLWTKDDGFHACRIADEAVDAEGCFDTAYILWGTRQIDAHDGFTLVVEGQRGLKHAVPLTLSKTIFGTGNDPEHPLRLVVRHYLDTDTNGITHVALCRLVDLYATEGGDDVSATQ